MVKRPQTQVASPSKPSILLLGKKRKYMPIKDETPSLEEVMTVMDSALKIRSTLSLSLKGELVRLLKEFEDVFAYGLEKMLGIDPKWQFTS